MSCGSIHWYWNFPRMSLSGIFFITFAVVALVLVVSDKGSLEEVTVHGKVEVGDVERKRKKKLNNFCWGSWKYRSLVWLFGVGKRKTLKVKGKQLTMKTMNSSTVLFLPNWTQSCWYVGSSSRSKSTRVNPILFSPHVNDVWIGHKFNGSAMNSINKSKISKTMTERLRCSSFVTNNKKHKITTNLINSAG